MKGLTHVLFGIGFVSCILAILETPIILWFVGTLILSPFFSRLPDYDQKIAKITFNHVVPHRGMHSHNLLYILPLFTIPVLRDSPILLMIIVSVFGALFAHTLVDAFNSGGVWFGLFQISVGKMSWDSFKGNLLFKSLGILLLIISCFNYV